jgi:hypothetical protein
MSKEHTLTELINVAKALKEKAEQAADKAEQFYIELGHKLAELKERKPAGTTWPEFVRKHFDYSKARADELIRIATGVTTVAASREEKKKSVDKSRKKKRTLRSVQSSDKGSTKRTSNKQQEAIAKQEWEKRLTPQEKWEFGVLELINRIGSIDRDWTNQYGEWRQFSMTPCTYRSLVDAASILNGLISALKQQTEQQEQGNVVQIKQRSA